MYNSWLDGDYRGGDTTKTIAGQETHSIQTMIMWTDYCWRCPGGGSIYRRNSEGRGDISLRWCWWSARQVKLEYLSTYVWAQDDRPHQYNNNSTSSSASQSQPLPPLMSHSENNMNNSRRIILNVECINSNCNRGHGRNWQSQIAWPVKWQHSYFWLLFVQKLATHNTKALQHVVLSCSCIRLIL